MNPENIEKILAEVEKTGNFDGLRDIEDKMIHEIAVLAMEGTPQAKEKLKKIEASLERDLKRPRGHLLLSALRNSLSGAISAAKFSLF